VPGVDYVLAAVLFTAAAVVGSAYVRAFDRTGARTAVDLRTLPSRSMWYGQSDFGAAVTLACGRGYVDPGHDLTPGLSEFLAVRVDRFSCAELPASLPQRTLNNTQRLYRYLLSAVAGVWAIRGVSWSTLWPLFGLFYGATVAVCYGLFRLGMGPVAATAAAAAITISPVHLANLPGLRDYAKAPFILGLILIAARLARHVHSKRSTFALSGLFGAVLGVGFGFRNDIVIVAPLFVVGLLAWEPPRDGRGIRTRVAAIAIAATTFMAVALPILSGYTQGSNSGHVALMGLMTPFDRPLGIAGSVYEWGHVYSDGFGDTLIQSYSERVHGRPVGYLSAEYDRAMFEYLLLVVRHWPADVLTRASAAVLRIVDLPFTPGTHADAIPYALQGATLPGLYEWHNAGVSILRGKGLIAVALVLLVLSRSSVWGAVLLLVSLLYVAGYPAIQFQPRHFFHLEFIAWWALGFLVERSVPGVTGYVRARRRSFPRPSMSRAAAKRMAWFALTALAVIALPLAGARSYQQRHMRGFLRAYVDAPRDRLPLEPVGSGERTLLRAPTLWADADPGRGVRTQYVVARVSPATCPVVRLPLTFRYATVNGQPDFSLDMTVTFLPALPVEIFFPAYRASGKFTFEGIEVSRGFERCVEEITRVRHLDSLPILVNLTLTSGWEQSPLYQRIAEWEVSDRTPFPSLYTLPPALTVAVRTLDKEAVSPPLLWQMAMVRDATPRGWTITGTPPLPEWPLLEFAAEPRTPDDQFVMEGEIVRGGITIGLVRGHQWTGDGHVTITKAGRFLAVLAPPAAGEYGVLCVNGLGGSWFLSHAAGGLVRLAGRFHHFNDVRITRARWIRQQ
jgi:hypothetical protein